MDAENQRTIEGSQCKVIAGTHKGKSGIAKDLKMSKTGHLTITVIQENGVRFKTLGKNVEVVDDFGNFTKSFQ
jgi:ribosomal protein S4E